MRALVVLRDVNVRPYISAANALILPEAENKPSGTAPRAAATTSTCVGIYVLRSATPSVCASTFLGTNTKFAARTRGALTAVNKRVRAAGSVLLLAVGPQLRS